jgi:hypothetical protein
MNRPLTPILAEKNENNKLQEMNSIKEEQDHVVTKSQLFISLYTTLKCKFKEDEINVGSMISILKTTMELIETIDDLKGAEQKNFAVLLVKELINKSKLLSQEQKRNCLMVIDFGVLDTVVDFVVDATNGNVAINKKSLMKKIKKLFSCCCRK